VTQNFLNKHRFELKHTVYSGRGWSVRGSLDPVGKLRPCCRRLAHRGRLKTQVRKTKVPGDGICKYRIGLRKYECAGWKMQVLKTQVRICNGGTRKYSNLTSILKSLRYSTLAFSVDPLSVGLDQFTCTVPDRCYT